MTNLRHTKTGRITVYIKFLNFPKHPTLTSWTFSVTSTLTFIDANIVVEQVRDVEALNKEIVTYFWDIIVGGHTFISKVDQFHDANYLREANICMLP